MATILLVDDVYTARSLLERVLRLVGRYDVVAVSSGEEAVRVALEASPDLIVLDVMMSDLDGVATLQALRARGVACPVLAYTARSEQFPGEFAQHGFSAYLQKNGDLSALLSTVRNLLGRSIATAPATLAAPDPVIATELKTKAVGDEDRHS
ncbi:MAG: response regulator [Oscillochloridaceae bacterium]|nr:response regulator [Chloroflexaceae bacterium]MDW8391502.1 response regulator [Oscillochloridaceae bacterium]